MKKGVRVCAFVFRHRNADASPLGPVKHTYHQCLPCRWGKDPVIPESSEADVSTRQTGADGTSFCFGKARRAVCLNLNICGGQNHLKVKSPFMMS